jgi:hypothetical protein
VPAEAHADPLAYPAGDDTILALLHGLLRRTHLSTPSDTSAVIADQARCIGARDVALYLIDYDLSMLVPVPGGASGTRAVGPRDRRRSRVRRHHHPAGAG